MNVDIYTMQLGKVLEVQADEIIIPVKDFDKTTEEIIQCARNFFEIFDIKQSRRVDDQQINKTILIKQPLHTEKWDIRHEKQLATIFGFNIYESVIIKLRKHFGHNTFAPSEVSVLLETHLITKREIQSATFKKATSAYLSYLVKHDKVKKLGGRKYKFIYIIPTEVDSEFLARARDEERKIRRDK